MNRYDRGFPQRDRFFGGQPPPRGMLFDDRGPPRYTPDFRYDPRFFGRPPPRGHPFDRFDGPPDRFGGPPPPGQYDPRFDGFPSFDMPPPRDRFSELGSDDLVLLDGRPAPGSKKRAKEEQKYEGKCHVCDVDYNSWDQKVQHELGKRHIKNIDKKERYHLWDDWSEPQTKIARKANATAVSKKATEEKALRFPECKKCLTLIGAVNANHIGCATSILYRCSSQKERDAELARKDVRKSGMTPLHKASAAVDREMVHFLLAQKGDPNIRDNENNTALHCAAKKSSYNICKLLLNNGADPKLINNGSLKPVEVAKGDAVAAFEVEVDENEEDDEIENSASSSSKDEAAGETTSVSA